MRSRTTPPRKDLMLKIKLRTKMRKSLQRMKISFQKIKLTMIAVMVAVMMMGSATDVWTSIFEVIVTS